MSLRGRSAATGAEVRWMRDPDPDAPPDSGAGWLTGAGAAARFTAVFDEYAAGLWRFLARQVDATHAEDLVAETFLRAWSARDDYRAERGTVRAWLYGIALNLLRRHHRNRLRQDQVAYRLSGQHQSVDGGEDRIAERLDARARIGALTAAIAALPDGDREVLLLGSLAGLDTRAQTLTVAADAQIHAIDTPVPAGQYRYIATHSLALSYDTEVNGTFAVRTGSRTETWVPADPAGEWTSLSTDTGERTWLLGTAQQARAAGVPDTVSPPTLQHARCGDWYPQPGVDSCNRPGGWQVPTASFTAGLPRDPRKLFARLRTDTRGHGTDRDQEILVYAADALRSGLLPADLRAALYRALALLPTLTITERVAALDGRTGTALGVTTAGTRMDIVIDPGTGDFIGERTRQTEDRGGLPAGTLIGSSSVSYGVARRAGERPAG